MVSRAMTAAAVIGIAIVAVGASPKSKKRSEVRSQALAKRLSDIRKSYVDNLVGLAIDYSKMKDYGRARLILRSIKTVAPKDERAVRLEESLDSMESRQDRKDIRIDVSRGWVSTGCRAVKGHRVFFSCKGLWVLRLAERVDPDGVQFKTEAPRLPIGALIGRIGEKGRPFLIGSGTDMVARGTGQIYLKVNVRNTAVCNGQVNCAIAGSYEKESGRQR